MKPQMYLLRGSLGPTPCEPRIPRRWRWFIALSTGSFLALAGVLALWFPEYRAVAWALLLFSSCHVSFLVVQRIGCEPMTVPEAGLEEEARQGDAASPLR
jgi:hypothetical protein